MGAKIKREELLVMDAVDVYKLVLKRDKIKIFPRGFWDREESISDAVKCIKYLIEDRLKLSDEEILYEVKKEFFIDNSLRGMLDICFNGSPIEAIEATYPGKFLPWSFRQVPRNFWEEEIAILATRWLIQNKLKLSDDELKLSLSAKLFKDNNLGGMLAIVYNDSPFKAIESAFPGKYKEWEFVTSVKRDFWDDEKSAQAVRWLVEERLKLSEEEVKLKLCKKLFLDNNLGGLLATKFGNKVFNAIDAAYPGKYKITDFKNHKRYR